MAQNRKFHVEFRFYFVTLKHWPKTAPKPLPIHITTEDQNPPHNSGEKKNKNDSLMQCESRDDFLSSKGPTVLWCPIDAPDPLVIPTDACGSRRSRQSVARRARDGREQERRRKTFILFSSTL
ncbi:hypothetical protein NPIL_125131 [Nephila pilipes]|uniref:Uncharacterized protein n=1 Tax=Nephila pilipes TaxID=299642 RepID=A0A8X6PQX4_NEPPI|nr:hypothetical protein NPIL_125131 [Nephila pilipes]